MKKDQFGTKMDPQEGGYMLIAVIAAICSALMISSGFRFPGSLDMWARFFFGGVMFAASIGYIIHLKKKRRF